MHACVANKYLVDDLQQHWLLGVERRVQQDRRRSLQRLQDTDADLVESEAANTSEVPPHELEQLLSGSG